MRTLTTDKRIEAIAGPPTAVLTGRTYTTMPHNLGNEITLITRTAPVITQDIIVNRRVTTHTWASGFPPGVQFNDNSSGMLQGFNTHPKYAQNVYAVTTDSANLRQEFSFGESGILKTHRTAGWLLYTPVLHKGASFDYAAIWPGVLSDQQIYEIMRILDNRPTVTGVNLFPDLSLWTMLGGATYDSTTKEITLTDTSSFVKSPLIRVDKPKTLYIGYNLYIPSGGDDRMYIAMGYNKTREVSNRVVGDGHSTGYAPVVTELDTWITRNHSWITWFDGDKYAEVGIYVTPQYGVVGTKIRNGSAAIYR